MEKLAGLYSQIISKENLYRSTHMASRHRRYRDTTADFNFHLEEEIGRLHDELVKKTYRHGKYRLFTIHDPKEREIAAAPFRDRVVHHAVHDVVEPFIDKTFIYDSYACRNGKGTHKAVGRAQGFLKTNKFCFHGDIKKYFPSIDHNILKQIIVAKIMDKDLLWLVDEIIDSARQLKVAVGNLQFADKGLPIGNLTSQFFANLYLNELDYFVKFQLRCRYYVRYMDDFLIFDNDRKALIDIKEKVRDFLKNKLALELHPGKSQIYDTEKGIKFLGFRLYKNYRRLATDNVRRFKKRIKRFDYLFENGKISADKISDSVRCWVAHSKYANTGRLRHSISSGLAHGRLGSLLKDVLLGKTKMEGRGMKKVTVAITLLLLTLSLGNLAFAGQYQGGPGSGGAMAESEFRLDRVNGSKSEIASPARDNLGRDRNDGDGAQYRGGQGSGGAMVESAGYVLKTLESKSKDKKEVKN